jgi:hypothetical protein
MSTDVKRSVLATIAGGAPLSAAGRSKQRIGSNVVHVRFCSASSGAPGKFKFNINPNTLSADFELWICGEASIYYLIPISFISNIYDNPNTYQDKHKHHEKIKVVSVDAHDHSVMFAAGGANASIRPFLRATLPSSRSRSSSAE